MSVRVVSRLLPGIGWALLLAGLVGFGWSVAPIPRERMSVTDGEWELAWDAPRWLRAGEATPVRLEAMGSKLPAPSESEVLEPTPNTRATSGGQAVLVAELHAGGAVVEPAPVLVTPVTSSGALTFAWTIEPPLTEGVTAELLLRLQSAGEPSARALVWGRSMRLPVVSLLGFTAPAARAAGLVGVLAAMVVIFLGSRLTAGSSL